MHTPRLQAIMVHLVAVCCSRQGEYVEKSSIKEIQVDEAQPEIILPIRNPVPLGSQTAAKADRISLGHNKRKNPASGINRRYSF